MLASGSASVIVTLTKAAGHLAEAVLRPARTVGARLMIGLGWRDGRHLGYAGCVRTLLRPALLLGLALLPAPLPAQTPPDLTVYPYPRPVKYTPGDLMRDPHHNGDFTVRVRASGGDWQDLYEHNVKVDWNDPQNASMVAFDFRGKAEISVQKNNGLFSKVRIRPNPEGIEPVINGNTVHFTIGRPQNLSVEFDSDSKHNLHIFAGLPYAQRPEGLNVVYFGPGVHKPENGAEAFTARSGQTVYIDGGAVLDGAFVLESVHDVAIIGHGIIEQPKGGFLIKHSSNIRVEGLTFINPAHGTLACRQSQHVVLSSIKTFSAVPWGDGINIYSCEDVSLDKAFIRTSDDCFTVYGHRDDTYGDARHIRVSNSVFWADTAHAMFLGMHGNTEKPETIEDVVFKNIDVLDLREDQPDYQGVMAIYAGDGNLVRNITFEDIRVDHIEEGKLFNFRVGYNSKYNSGPGRGIENITLRNIAFTGQGTVGASVIEGYDQAHSVRHIEIENLRIDGQKLTEPAHGVLEIGHYADGVTFR